MRGAESLVLRHEHTVLCRQISGRIRYAPVDRRWLAALSGNTATNHASRWLFPGRRAGQPLHPDVLAALLNDLGIPTTAGRTTAIRQHVLEMPAPSSRRLPATTGSPLPRAGLRGRRHLEPIRLERQPAVTTTLDPAENWWQLKTRARQ
jgi:hypothetical protein